MIVTNLKNNWLQSKVTEGKYMKGGVYHEKTRSDCRVGTFEKKHGLPSGSIRRPDGRDIRSDCKVGTLRKRAGK